MSGVEIVGVLLGAFPLLIKALNSYPNGARTAREWNRFRIAIDEYIDTLSTQKVIFWDRVVQLLDGIVPPADLDNLYRGGGTVSYMDSVISSEVLEKRLGAEKYYLFVKHSKRMAESLGQIERLLRINKDGEIPWANAGFIKREKGKIRLVINKEELRHLFGRIRQANDDLDALTRRNVITYDHPHRKSQMRTTCYRENIMQIRMQLQSLLRVLVDPLRWRCACRGHTTTVRLAGARRPDQQTRLSICFTSILQTDQHPTNLPKNWKCLEVDYVEAELPPTPATPKHRTSSVRATLTRAAETSVFQRLISMVTLAPLVVPVPRLIPLSGIRLRESSKEIGNLCEILRTPGGYSSQQAIGYLHDSSAFAKHLFYPSPQYEIAIDLLPLTAVFDANKASRSLHTPAELLWNQRLHLAFILALNALRMGGSWMKDRWSSCDILLPRSGQSLDTSQPYIVRDITDIPPNTVSLNRTNSLATILVRCEAIFSLGLALVELAFGQLLSQLRRPEDEDPNDTLRDLKTATRLLPKIKGNRGLRYHQATKTCLLLPSTLSSTSLDDRDFQEFVLAEVVTPIKADLETIFFLDSTMPFSK